jgi:hypothetical protein
MLVETIHKHPFKGMSKNIGDRYEMNPQEFRVFSALGHVRLAEVKKVIAQPPINSQPEKPSGFGKPKAYNRRDMRAFK